MADVERRAARAADELAAAALRRGDPTGWFEQLYGAATSEDDIPWFGGGRPNRHLVAWLDAHDVRGEGRPALVVGTGLGDDAEELARRGFAVTAFDIAPTAIAWARRRFPGSPVDYRVADVLEPPAAWEGAFAFVAEAYTLQAIPADLRRRAAARIAGLLQPGGTLLVIAHARADDEPAGDGPPWPLSAAEVRALFPGLEVVRLEAYADEEPPHVGRLRVELRRGAEELRGAGSVADRRRVVQASADDGTAMSPACPPSQRVGGDA